VATRRIGWLATIALIPSLGGCAAVVGTALGPVTGPISAFEHTYGIPTWAKVLLLPAAVFIGPAVGLAAGAAADVGFVCNGEYGAEGSTPFAAVFDPASPEWGRPADHLALDR
jgi:hypothetical protein